MSWNTFHARVQSRERPFSSQGLRREGYPRVARVLSPEDGGQQCGFAQPVSVMCHVGDMGSLPASSQKPLEGGTIIIIPIL